MNNNNLNNNNQIIKLGGFPPILYINNENKKIREFKNNLTNSINLSDVVINKLNILSIKDILGTK